MTPRTRRVYSSKSTLTYRIIDNSMRYSGDGLFIRANNRHGSDHNHIARNDGSFSPNNAFEAGFSAHTPSRTT